MSRKYEIIPLENDHFRRITEINFRNLLDYFAEKFGSPAFLNNFIETISLQLALPPNEISELMRLSFADKSLPASKDEMIEIYYRSGHSRRRIMEATKVRGDRITRVITRDESDILPYNFTLVQMALVIKLIDFFGDAAERMV